MGAGPSTMAGRGQRGFSLLVLAIVLGLLAVLAAAVLVVVRQDDTRRAIAVDDDRLDAAERALMGFVAGNGRLPCPDTSGDGQEDCAAGAQKGWLPSVSLGLDAAGGGRGEQRMAYIVYRAGGLDLAAPGNRFDPGTWEYWKTSPPDPLQVFPLNHQNVLDLCTALELAEMVPAADAARVAAGGVPLAVAYGIAAPRSALGGAAGFEGANAAAAPVLESPARPVAADYDDRVRVRLPGEARALFQCPSVTASLHAMGQAVEVVAEVNDQKLWSTVLGAVLAGVGMGKTAVVTYKGIKAAVAVATAAATLSSATAGLSSAIGSCAVLVGCALIPTMAAAVASAAAGLVAAAAATAAYAAAIPTYLASAGLYASVAIEAGVALGDDSVDWNSILAELNAAAVAAAANANTARGEANLAWENANAAEADYDIAVSDLYATAADYHENGNNFNSLLDAALAAHRNYIVEEIEFTNAEGERDSAFASRDQAFAAWQEAAAEAALHPDDTDKAALAQTLYESYLAANGKANEKNAAVVAAQAERDAAWDAYQTARSTAVDAYRYQYQRLIGNDSNGDPIYQTVTVDGRAAVSAALDRATEAYRDWQGLVMVAELKETTARQAEAEAANADAAYQQVLAARSNPSANATEITVWSGAQAILERADEKGAME